MIRVGDKFNLNNKNWEVILIDNDAVVVARSENGEEGIVSQRTIYKNWYEQQKQRADELEKRFNSLKEYIPSLRLAIESTLYYSHPDIEPNLQSDIGSYSSLMEQICKDLEEDGE